MDTNCIETNKQEIIEEKYIKKNEQTEVIQNTKKRKIETEQDLESTLKLRSTVGSLSSHSFFSRTANHTDIYDEKKFATNIPNIIKPSKHLQIIKNHIPFSTKYPALRFTIQKNYNKARVSLLELPHGIVETPVFMPVGTQGSIKGLCTKQLEEFSNIKLILGNTYHLGIRPGTDVIFHKGGLHQFQNWDNNLLTDSGGFQMVSLFKLAKITEEGVNFISPVDGSDLLLTPERFVQIFFSFFKYKSNYIHILHRSMQYQNEIGSDIMMALDDVCHVLTTGERVQQAMERTIRWQDRCIKAHKRPNIQNQFGIVQGGLQLDLRIKCLQEQVKRDLPGYAIGGLSGGEEKELFWRIVDLCTDYLPNTKPRYCMGVGYPLDILACVALGVDMFDCVWPSRTARFGSAIVSTGVLKLPRKQYQNDIDILCDKCPCIICSKYKMPRFYLHHLCGKSLGCSLLTIHNLTYMSYFMESIRKSLKENTFPQFVTSQLKNHYPDHIIPLWLYNVFSHTGCLVETFSSS